MTTSRARIVSGAFFVLWAFVAAYSALNAYYYWYTGLLYSFPTVIVALAAGTLVLLLIAIRGGGRLKAYVLFLAACLLSVELSLQALAFFGKIKNLSMVEDFAPYSRVYTSGNNAHGNSYCNRYGWHARPFRLEPGSRRIALIGDSFIHAVETDKNRHMSVYLENLLRQHRPQTSWEVLPLGISGTGPAQYFEMLRYAKEYLGVTDAVIFVTEGNDFMNSVYEQMPPWWNPSRYIYYYEDADGSVKFDPRSEPARYRMLQEFKLNHRALFWSLGRTARSNFILERLLKQLVQMARLRRNPQAFKIHNDIKDEFTALSLDPFIYTVPLPPEGQKSTRILTSVLRMSLDYARQNGIKVRFVTIPYFPGSFYKQAGPNWSSRIGTYDLLQPERIMTDFAKKTGTPILTLGENMRAQKMTPKDIYPLFMFGGFGHFNEEGHQYVAQALYDHFFAAER